MSKYYGKIKQRLSLLPCHVCITKATCLNSDRTSIECPDLYKWVVDTYTIVYPQRKEYKPVMNLLVNGTIYLRVVTNSSTLNVQLLHASTFFSVTMKYTLKKLFQASPKYWKPGINKIHKE